MEKKVTLVTRDDLQRVLDKAKTKKDGVYSYNNMPYFVKDNSLRLIGEYNKVYEWSYGFLVSLGTIENHYKLKDEIKRLSKFI
jgi:hypothetical protein